MRIQDVDVVLGIETLCFPSPWSRQQFVDEIQCNPLSRPMVIRKREGDGYAILAYCVCWVVAGELHVNNIAVHPDYRRQGCGEWLMRWALALADESGCKRIVLEVRTSNEGAIRLYRKLGFEVLGTAPGYYEDSGEDAYIFVKKVGAGP
jgi:ribosomal-protein-alanine N-acetyltransferase